MGHATIKKYRRKTMKNKSKGKKLHLKKNLKLRTKQKNAKKTQKRFRLKNKTKRMKRMKKTKKIKKMKGGEDEDETELLTFPDRKDDKYKKEDGKFDGAAYMKAIQAYNKQQAEAMHVENPTEDRVNIENIGEECTNVDPLNNSSNEFGQMKPKFLKFQFEGKPQIYCYNYEDIKQDLDNIGNICCVWKKTNPEAEDNEEGYGTSCIVRSTYDLLGNVCNYINDPMLYEINNPEAYTAEDDYLCVWRSLINIRTWISQKAVKEIYENKCNSHKGKFILKNPKRTLIGNLYNVFGVGMLHGQQPGEFIFDIKFELDNNNTTAESCTISTSTDFILDKRKLLTEYGKIYDQFWNDINVNNESYDPNDDSFASQSSISYEEQPASVSSVFSNMDTPPISPIGPTRRLFPNTPDSISMTNNILNSPDQDRRTLMNDSVTLDETSPWMNDDLQNVLRDIDTTRSHNDSQLPPIPLPLPYPIVSLPTNNSNPITESYVFLSPGSGLRPTSTRRGNTYEVGTAGNFRIGPLSAQNQSPQFEQPRNRRRIGNSGSLPTQIVSPVPQTVSPVPFNAQGFFNDSSDNSSGQIPATINNGSVFGEFDPFSPSTSPPRR